MNKYLKLIYLLLLLISFNYTVVKAQADFGSEEEFKKQAAKLFNEEEYVKAYPLYTQLVSLYKKDPDYNYRLGVCMLYAIDDKEKAIPYLEFALRTPDKIDKEAYFYLAKAFHLTYRFDDAIKKYQAYKKIASGAKAERLQVDRQIEMCGNGKKLLQNISDLMVIEKIDMNREDFFRAYDISGIGGKLLVKPDEKEFKTSLDKKKKESSIIYLVQNGSQIFFSSYGENEKNGKDIYQITKTASGEWGKAQPLNATINTKYDEDYPFLHPNGKTLYFCSKGHNSMGGYDIFKSTLNEETKEWSAPVNLDFPVNTPDDDILYLTDKEEKKAYFSSARASEAGKIAVYNINVERRPIDFAVIRGTVIKNTKNQEVSSKITIKNLSDNNMIVGIFNANPENGVYDIRLPNGGRFLFTVETPNFLPQSEVVEIPVQTQFKPLRQEISYELVSNKLIIKNLFNEPAADTSYLLALNLIKEKAKLEVGGTTDFAVNDTSKTETVVATPVDTASLASSKNNTGTTTGPELSNEDIIRIAYKDAKESETEAKELREQADISLGLANKKNELAQVKQLEASNLTAQAAKEDDNAKKQALTEKADEASQEAKSLNQETVVAFNLAKKIETTAAAKQDEADLSLQYAKGLEAAVKSDNSKEAVAKLDELEKKLEVLSQNNSASLPIVNSFKKDEENKKRELDRAIQESADLKQDMSDNETIIAGLKEETDKEKNEKIKENMNIQLAELKQENIDKKKQLEENEQKIVRLQKEYTSAKNEVELVSSVVDQSKVSDSASAAAQVAAIDRNKLEQRVNSIENSTAGTDIAVSTTKTHTTQTIAITTPLNTTDTVSQQNAATETGTQFVYADAAAGAQITEADILEKEANDLLAESISYRVDKDDKSTKSEQKEKRKKSEELAKKAQEKKEKSADLYAQANKTEYTANQKQLDAAAKVNTGSTSPDVFKAELLTDESKKYFDLAQEERKRAKNTKSYSEKEAALETARSNELIALEKQKEATEIYKNVIPGATTTTVASVNTTDTATVKPVNTVTTVVQPQTTETALADINRSYQSDLTATQTIQDEADREKAKADVLKRWSDAIDADLAKQKQDYEATTDTKKKEALAKRMSDAENSSKEKQNLAAESLTKAETIRQNQVAAANVTTPTNTVKADTAAAEVAVNTDLNDTSAAFEYNDPVANEQIEKSVMLSDQADALLAESIITDLQTTEPGDAERKKRKENGQKLIDEAQAKKLESAQLVATANTSEYSRKQKEINDVAKTTAGNTAPDLLKAEILSDEAQNYFNLAAEERKKAETAPSYSEKEMILQDAHENELLALQKQNESLALYKNYSPAVASNNRTTTNETNAVNNTTTTINTNEVTTPVNNTNTATETVKTTPASTNKQFVYSTPSAMEQSVKAASLNKQAEDIMTLSLDLKTQAIAQSNADAKNTMYAQSEELMKEARMKKMEAAQLTADANSSEYASNEAKINQYKNASAGNNSADLLKAELLSDEAQGMFNKAKALRQEAAATDSYFAREATLEDAAASERQALEKQKESIELYKKYTPAIAATTNRTAEKTNPGTTTTVTTPANATTTNSTAEIALAANESFEQKETAAYTSENPIPIDAKLPQGLIFKVQIGAFRKPIPQNLFKGMAPVTGETTSKGFIRYTAGIFTKFSTADKVKKKIIDMGYKDAFVVAFLNGKRIPVNEAYALAEDTPSTVLQATNTQVAENTTATVPDNQNEVIKAGNVTDVGGLFYTVQVGVFSQPVLASKLYSMSPLYSEKAPNGFLRYYTGTYTSITRAGEAKEMVVDIGIKDAFVTAYYNGKRVSMEAAQKYEAQGSAFPKGPEVNKLPSFKAVNKPVVPPRNTTAETIRSNPLPSGPGIVYKVQIGAFYEEVPLDMANKFLKIAKKGIRNYKDNNGLTIYTVGDSKTYDEANALKAQVIAEAELTDAFVVAYRDGKKIPVEEAKQSKNN